MAVPVASAISIGLMALDGAISLLTKAKLAQAAVEKAHAEGREHLTDAEWMNIQKGPTDSIKRLEDAIKNAPNDT